MSRMLGIAPLRSFVAVADCGGFQRAAASLHLTQGAVSQHVRRLEAALDRTLVERDGRGSRFTADGEDPAGPGQQHLAGGGDPRAAAVPHDQRPDTCPLQPALHLAHRARGQLQR
ncbi:LysR family transcriptional regulator, partial [Actinoplanes sp. NPDC048791]|uniref:helix-turn-helix domain-containing protein n=1 Tax=Actinoplanes sp. NPDC048791 TaxID=3154623 RepID=UPI0033E671B4